jgi:hypothetical protein
MLACERPRVLYPSRGHILPQLGRELRCPQRLQVRRPSSKQNMGGPPEKYPQPGKPYGGWKPNLPTATQSRIGWGFGVVMWLWVFHRARNDLPHMLVRCVLSSQRFALICHIRCICKQPLTSLRAPTGLPLLLPWFATGVGASVGPWAW